MTMWWRRSPRSWRRRSARAVAAASRANRDRSSIPGLASPSAPSTPRGLRRLDRLAALDRPILVGPSRKSFLNVATGERPPPERDWGTAAAVTASVLGGAHIVRVHDVREMADVVRVADRLRAAAIRH